MIKEQHFILIKKIKLMNVLIKKFNINNKKINQQVKKMLMKLLNNIYQFKIDLYK